MKRIEVNTMWTTVTVPVPETVDEYNALAPNRENAALEDAIKYQILHGTNSLFRTKFVNAVAERAGVTRINKGTEDAPKWESDGVFYERIAATLGQKVEDLSADNQILAQEIYDTIRIDPSARERSEGPTVGKGDKALAEELLKADEREVARVAGLLSKHLNRPVNTDADSLARAFGENRRRLAKIVAEQARSELGM